MTRIILLDIDGVLVQPGGYRAALRATVQHFVGDFEVEESLLTELEKRGISSEWDMAPLIVAAFWDGLLARHPMENLADDVATAAKEIQGQRWGEIPKLLMIPEFELVVGQYPAETAFHAGFFSHIPWALRKNLLTESRNIHKSETMRVFQNLTLGSRKFEETYQLSAEFEAESFLLTKDKSNISNEIRERLNHPANHIAAFTARPSGLPIEVEGSSIGYAPEAELALELVGMKDIPLMAFGKLEYVATQHGLNPAKLIKPAPFQALAGILAAWTHDELSALQTTYNWYKNNAFNGQFKHLPNSFDLIVVEDTMGGIFSTLSAGQILKAMGLDVHVFPVGLTLGSKSKAEIFQKYNIVYFENWIQLMEYLNDLKLSKRKSG